MLLPLAIAPTASAHDPTEIENTWRMSGVPTGIFAQGGSLAWKAGFRSSVTATFLAGVLLIETKATSGQDVAPSYQLWFYVLDEANLRIIIHRQGEVFPLRYSFSYVSWGVTLTLSAIGGGGTITFHRETPVATTPMIPAPE